MHNRCSSVTNWFYLHCGKLRIISFELKPIFNVDYFFGKHCKIPFCVITVFLYKDNITRGENKFSKIVRFRNRSLCGLFQCLPNTRRHERRLTVLVWSREIQVALSVQKHWAYRHLNVPPTEAWVPEVLSAYVHWRRLSPRKKVLDADLASSQSHQVKILLSFKKIACKYAKIGFLKFLFTTFFVLFEVKTL